MNDRKIHKHYGNNSGMDFDICGAVEMGLPERYVDTQTIFNQVKWRNRYSAKRGEAK